MKRRLKEYRHLNNSATAEPSVSDFFRKYNVDVYEENAAKNLDQAINGYKIYIERVIILFEFLYFGIV